MRIVSFGQSVNVENLSEVMHHFTVVTDAGEIHTLPATEELVAALVQISASEGGSAAESVYPTQVPETGGNGQTEWSAEGIEFGGDVDPGEVARESMRREVAEDDLVEAAMGVIAEEPASPPQKSMAGIGQKKPQPIVSSDGKQLAPRPKTVPKDSMGYPIVQQKRKVQAQQKRKVQAQLPVGDDEDGTQI